MTDRQTDRQTAHKSTSARGGLIYCTLAGDAPPLLLPTSFVNAFTCSDLKRKRRKEEEEEEKKVSEWTT